MDAQEFWTVQPMTNFFCNIILYAIFITAIFQDIPEILPNSFTIGILRISPKIPVVVDLAKKAQKQTISGRFWEIVVVKMNPRSPTDVKNMSADVLHVLPISKPTL